MTTSATTLRPAFSHASAPALSRARIEAALAIAFGVMLTLTMQGYQFGKSNHTVYLIDALRHTAPNVLQNDWFATQTLQYHAAFGLLTRGLMMLGIVEPAFLVGHVLLAVLLHVAWWRIVRAMGGGVAAFVLSEVLFHLSGGGIGLGMYQFLQDGAFLPSNIASVAFLWGIYFWMTGRRAAAAVMFGLSGLFHLNYAIVAPAMWIVLATRAWLSDRRRPTAMEWFAAAAMIELSLINIVPALIAIAQRGPKMPLAEFIEIYVNLRHPHHYAPLSWPIALWVSFLWPIPLAWMWFHKVEDHPTPPANAPAQAQRIVNFLLLLLVVAFVGAGVWYVSDTLVQLSLWRFSVFVKLLTCVAAAMWIVSAMKRERVITTMSAIVGLAMIAACVARGPYVGLFRMPDDDAKYLAACDWIQKNTPADAVFLIPPDEQAFRLRARRAIVVNYKCVPQLSAELPEWRERLGQVLMLDIRELPRPFDRTLKEIHRRYEGRQPEHYANVARRYGARYILLAHELPPDWEPRRVAAMNDNATDAYFLYDLRR
ncbi:MAG: hypothetical protein QOF78_59 [Phycisphaerales bacterium]|jgi:hypothetical protein|nr:hypothetical protein [Phycisphaerales bacterium]